MIKRLKERFAGSDYHFKEMIFGASTSFLFRILGAASQLVFSLLAARLFGAEGYGVYALALSITVIVSTLSRWGLDQSTLKHLSVFADQGQWGAVKEAFSKAFFMVAGLSVLATAPVYLLAAWLADVLFAEPGLVVMLRIMAFSIFPFALLNLIAESLRALKKVGLYTLVQGLFIPVLSSVILAGGYFAGSEVSFVAFAYVSACYLTLIIALLIWGRTFRQTSDTAMQGGCVASLSLLKTASPMAWVALVGMMMSFSETILLGVFHTSAEVGIYAIALRLALLINFVIIAFNSILAPKFAALHQQGAAARMEALANSSVRIMLLLTVPVFAVFFMVPDYLLLIFRPEFTDASTALVILAFGQLFNILSGPVGVILLMSGHEKVMRKNVFLAAMTSFSAGLLLIPSFGVAGAACAATLGMFILNFLTAWAVRKLLGIETIMLKPFSYR